ncbi:Dbl homology domain-containing protein [Radiomyces spectabilis]|uniref:Dbl homology domain-containing protein n=1 Tax=Radiomyces spectabilis TaxID=64574 RepID=UPI0022200711|nr:Dbl homology domain-containing protein [Radiomyces spectabilis]KAI8381542.1 Dbl homology domain-containing protein [Radiomyces spectabilis]
MARSIDDNGHLRPKVSGRANSDLRMNSISSASSQTSSQASYSVRYPSDMTSITDFTNDTPYTSGFDHYNDTQFDIIDTLDYDDVDHALIDQERVHRNRESLVHQLFTSEQAYVESLDITDRIFLSPLRKDLKKSSFNFLGMKKLACTEKELRWLFINFDEIVQIHHDILRSLEDRLRIWGPTQIISDVFHTWIPRLNAYHTYLDHYDVSVTTYERLSRYQPFKKFVDAAHKDKALRGATLLSLLQLPITSINRYAVLMSKLADATSPMHPDYIGLQKCKQKFLALSDEIKPKMTDADNVDQVMMLHQTIVGVPFSVKAQRRLVLQGQTAVVGHHSKPGPEERAYILFSDILVIVRPKQEEGKPVLHYKTHISLERARIRKLAPEETDDGQPHCIEITSSFQGIDTLNSTFMGSPTIHILPTSSQQDQDEWFKQLETVIAKLDKAAAASKAAASKRLAQSRSPPDSLRRQATTSNSSTHSGSSRQSS